MLADLEELGALERAVFEEGAYPAFFFRQAHDLWPQWLLTARDETGTLIGYVLGAPALAPGDAWLLSAATLPAQRGRGVGARLLMALLDCFDRSGVHTVWLTVHPDNPARRLYQRHGFVVTAERMDYFGPGQPRLTMQRQRASAEARP